MPAPAPRTLTRIPTTDTALSAVQDQLLDKLNPLLSSQPVTLLSKAPTEAAAEDDFDLSVIAAATTNPARQALQVAVPATPTSFGQPGMVAADTGFLYICIATNLWRRVVIAAW